MTGCLVRILLRQLKANGTKERRGGTIGQRHGHPGAQARIYGGRRGRRVQGRRRQEGQLLSLLCVEARLDDGCARSAIPDGRATPRSLGVWFRRVALEAYRAAARDGAHVEASNKTRDGFVLGCPFGNLAAEVGGSEPLLTKRVDEALGAFADSIREALMEAKRRGSVPRTLDVRKATDAVLAFFEGVMLLAKARNIRRSSGGLRRWPCSWPRHRSADGAARSLISYSLPTIGSAMSRRSVHRARARAARVAATAAGRRRRARAR